MEAGMRKDGCRIFEKAGRRVTVYMGAEADSPVIYLNTFADEGAVVYQALRERGCPDFTLAAISGLDWEHDMAPWDIPPITAGEAPFTGGADAYLRLLTEEIMPEAEKAVRGQAVWRGLAGYSLGGLFAVYSMYRTDAFSRIAGISSSLWFPGFQEFVFSHEIPKLPEHLYFSLGDRECRTRNPYLRTVQERTERIEAFYRHKGIDTAYEMNPGNHFRDAAGRTASGITWILSR